MKKTYNDFGGQKHFVLCSPTPALDYFFYIKLKEETHLYIKWMFL